MAGDEPPQVTRHRAAVDAPQPRRAQRDVSLPKVEGRAEDDGGVVGAICAFFADEFGLLVRTERKADAV